jgi:uncharacterized protein YpmB
MKIAIIINLLIVALVVVALFWFVRSSSPQRPAFDSGNQYKIA